MAGRKLLRKIERARARAESRGDDPDQAERDVRQAEKMAPLDQIDKDQRREKGMPIHPSLDPKDADGKRKQMDGGMDAPTILDDLNMGADGKLLKDAERLKRDAAIIQLLKRGISPEQVGAQFALTARTVRRIKARWREAEPGVAEIDATEIVQATLDNYEAAIEELAIVAARTTNPGAKVGAVKVRLEALRGRIELLQAVGVVPHDLGQLRVIDDAQDVARRIAEVFNAYGISEDAQMAVVDVIEGRAPQIPELVGEAEEVADAEVLDGNNNGGEGHG